MALWLSVLLFSALTWAQSGDEEAAVEPRISCTSDISVHHGNSLTCHLVHAHLHDDDDEDQRQDIQKMTVCLFNMKTNSNECTEASGETISILSGITAPFNLTVYVTGSATINRVINLREIVKPRSPRVHNVTFNLQSNQAIIHFWTPYQHDFLGVENQLFQLHIWSASRTLIQNVSSSETLAVGLGHLQTDTKYWVRVRSIPADSFQGTWSEWSPSFSFSTALKGTDREESAARWLIISKTVPIVAVLVLLTSSIVFWKKKLYTWVWPSIPHPKHTLVQICRPNKALLVSFTPEVFSALNVYPVGPKDEQDCGEAKSTVPPDPDATQATCSSDHSTSSSSVGAESQELCSLQSSSGEHEYTRPSHMEGRASPPPDPRRARRDPHTFEVREQDEDYVTMSSFYQSQSK